VRGIAGAVSSVKDQGLCGSCYTFSATGAVEGAYALKHGRMVELSMQQVCVYVGVRVRWSGK
jgi:C1A family cysteine protease